ncbi:MAG: hypothetical protein RLN60_00515 [Phycisphaerales bacterium]
MNSVWPILVVVVISILTSVIGKLKEQAEIKKAQEAKRRRYEEQIRTGATVSPRTAPQQPQQQTRPQPQPRIVTATTTDQREARLQEIRERRQAELRELRERQARLRQQQAPGPARPGTPAQREPRAVRPGMPRPAEPKPSPPRGRGDGTQGSESSRDVIQRRDRERQREIAQTREIETASQRKLEAAQRERDRLRARLDRERNDAATLLGTQREIGDSLRHVLTGGSMKVRRARLRQVVALNEIFSKPVSERRDHLGT